MSHPEPSAQARPYVAVIAAQNDAFRRFACLGLALDRPLPGRMHVTRAVFEAGPSVLAEAVKATGAFDRFEPEGWHDFGAVTIQGETLFWKIDLYETASDFRYGAETPDDPETTTRVLTIMMARDW